MMEMRMKTRMRSTMMTQSEKTLGEHGDKLEAEVKDEVQKAIDEAKSVKDSDDLDEIKAKISDLQQSSLKIGQAVYGQQGGEDAAAGAEGGEEKKDDDDTVDA